VVLQSSRVQLTGAVDELLDAHRTLVGPRAGSESIAGVAEVVRASHTERQSTLLVRRDPAGPIDPLWTEHEVTLEDLVLAHLAAAEVRVAPSAWEVPA
jgi:ABC-2 type transport system ATP-binding protein